MKLLENYIKTIVENWDDEEELPSPTNKTIADLKALRTRFAQVAQKEYDNWCQDEDGHCEWNGYGGICHLIADAMADAMSEAGIVCSTVSSFHEVHVYCVAQVVEGIYEVDIRPYVYETGGGYTWKKIPDVVFEPSDITIQLLDPDPNSFNEYIEQG